MPLITLPINNLSNSIDSLESLISPLSQSSSKINSPSSSSNKKYLYPILDLFLIKHEQSLLDLHDILMDNFNNLGFLNKSKSHKFIELLLDNIYIEDYNTYYKLEPTPKLEEINDYYETSIDDSYYI